MTLRNALFSAMCLLPLGCAEVAPGPPDVARLQPGQLGTTGTDPDITAATLAEWAFADPSRTYGKPAEAARAAAAIDYLAGELAADPRWAIVSADTKDGLLQGRAEVRDALGVVPGASSQAVVDHLSAAANALAAGDEAAAARQLGPPTFNASGEEILARLGKLPYLRMANVSTARAADELAQPNTGEYWPQAPLPSAGGGYFGLNP